jgi:hypothetical protein
MYRKGNILEYLRFRKLGVERRFFRFKVVILSRPPGDLPYEDYYNY